MMRKPIGHLSSRSYYTKKRWNAVIIGIIVVAAIVVIFKFTGENMKYWMSVNSGINNFKKGRTSYALSDFNRALNIKPNGALALDGLGLIAVKQNDFEKGRKYYTEALAAGLKFNSRINHTFFGMQYLDAGLYQNASFEFEQELKLNQSDPDALFGTGCSLHAAGQLDSAINYYNKALMYRPKFIKARKNLSMAEDDRNKGAMYYMFDSSGDPLARYNLIDSDSKRSYIYDQKTAHITGFVSERRARSEGMEKYLAEYMPGNKVYLTIDMRVQNAISRAMGWYKGAIVVLRPQTGEILGLYSQPTYRPSTIDRDWWKVVGNPNNPLLNRATDRLYEPGSIAKVITVGAAYERGINESDIFPIKCAGSTQFNNTPFWCWAKHGRVKSILHTIETSCNIGMAFLGFAVGSPTLYEYNQKFGFGTQYDLGITDTLRNKTVSIPVKMSSAPENDANQFETAMHASGLSLPGNKLTYSITPLHAAMLAAAIANQGIMMKPYIVKEIRNINGKVIYQGVPSEAKRPITPITAQKITQLMTSVVTDGIGQKAQVSGITVAGKTGTSGKGGNLNAWFISFAPAENPQYAIAILGDGEGKGMTVAAPIAGEIYRELLK
ncbi:MAG: hypothetical protein LLG37_00655 [Spirochaetia bacterium]|nr:hypothetical protein [Spirochaetia bacterium]